jgi:hypothetical protein
MSDAPKPNHDHLKLALTLLTAVTGSAAVQKLLNGDIPTTLIGTTNRSEANGYDLKYALRDIEDLRERVKRLEEGQ